jgi:hypothetical protein
MSLLTRACQPEFVRPKKLLGSLLPWLCFLAVYLAGIVLFDWLTNGWPNLSSQLGSDAVLLLISTVWSRRQAARKASATGAVADQSATEAGRT